LRSKARGFEVEEGGGGVVIRKDFAAAEKQRLSRKWGPKYTHLKNYFTY